MHVCARTEAFINTGYSFRLGFKFIFRNYCGEKGFTALVKVGASCHISHLLLTEAEVKKETFVCLFVCFKQNKYDLQLSDRIFTFLLLKDIQFIQVDFTLHILFLLLFLISWLNLSEE